MVFLLAILFGFILYPIARVLFISLSDDQGNLTLVHFVNFFVARFSAKRSETLFGAAFWLCCSAESWLCPLPT